MSSASRSAGSDTSTPSAARRRPRWWCTTIWTTPDAPCAQPPWPAPPRSHELFAQLLLPLRERRSIVLDADFAAETATAFVKHRYAFDDVDVVLVEGVYLLKRDLRAHYDVSAWIDCSFETALERALARGQEGL